MVVVDVKSASKDLCGFVSIVQGHGAVVITSEAGNAVLVSEEDWDSIMETLHVMGDSNFLKNLEEARSTPVSEREVWNRAPLR
jgi:prevent-host-death family protein